MFFSPFEVTTPHVIYALLGAFIVLFGMFSLLLREKLYIGEAIWAFVFGIIIGPYGANIFNPRSWGNSSNPEEPINLITLEFTRVVLAIGVFAIGVELPKAYLVKHWKSLFFLLVPVMAWGWFVCAGLIYALIPGLNFLSSLAISACLTPTDPILASAVVGGKWADKHVPAHIRHLLAAESGCNDGAAFPFLFFALYLMTDLPSVGNAMRDWFLILWLYDVILGIVIGSFLGFSFCHLMKFCQRHDLIDRQSYVAQYLSLAILSIGLTTLLGTDDLLAAFSCGTAFAWDGFFNKQTEESVFSSVIDILFNVAAFIFVGAWMPFNSFHQDIEGQAALGVGVEVWRLVILAILVLLLRRLPIMLAVYRWIPDVKTWREAVFSGHFGPMGIGAIFISTLANEFLKDHVVRNPTMTGYQQHQIKMVMDRIQPIVAFMVVCSIIIHGLSIPGFSLGRRVHSVSRTWSRRDTNGSGRVGAPDWTNQARLVSKAEDIVINRDRDLERGGVPLEKTMTMMSMRTLDGGDGVVKSESSTEVGPTKDKNQSQERHHQTSEWIEGDQRVVERILGGSGEDVEVTVIDESPNHRKSERLGVDTGTGRPHSLRDSVWRSFNHGRKRGLGGGGGGGASEVIMEMGTRNLKGRPTTADTLVADEHVDGSQEEGIAATAMAPIPGVIGEATTAAPVPTPAARERKNRQRSSSLTRLPPSRLTGLNQPNDTGTGTINLNLDTDYQDYDQDYDAGGDGGGVKANADNLIVEVPRGREERVERMNLNNNSDLKTHIARRTMSGSSLMSHMNSSLGMRAAQPPPTATMTTILPSSASSILPSVFPSQSIPLSYPPTTRSRPRTAPTSPTTSGSTTPITTRPGTGDSSHSIRHHRLDTIRAIGTSARSNGHRSPTRDSSPSRSVRFVDGESGYGYGFVRPDSAGNGSGSSVNLNWSGNGNGGRTVSVVEIPPPIPPLPSSPSFIKDGNSSG